MSPYQNISLVKELTAGGEISHISKSWMTVKEPISIWSDNSFTVLGILEHLNVTKDKSDYLWLMTRYLFVSLIWKPLDLWLCRKLVEEHLWHHWVPLSCMPELFFKRIRPAYFKVNWSFYETWGFHWCLLFGVAAYCFVELVHHAYASRFPLIVPCASSMHKI